MMGFQEGFYFVTDLSEEGGYIMVLFLAMTAITIISLFIEFNYIRKQDEKVTTHKLSRGMILVTILTLLTPLLFSYLWPSSYTRIGIYSQFEFWGSYEYDYYSKSWGPNVGWYLQILGFILMLLIIIIILATKEGEQSPTDHVPTPPVIPVQDTVKEHPGIVSELSEDLHCIGYDKTIPSDAKLCPYCGVEVEQ